MLKLIYKDFFICQGKNIYVLPLFAVMIIAQMQMFEVVSMFPLVIISMSLFAFTMTAERTFSCDETSKFNRFLRATPVSAKAVVLSRYASCLLSAVIGVLLLIAVGIITNAVSAFYPSLWKNISVDIDSLLLCLAVLILVCAILFPILFRFGYTKAKYPLMLLIIAIGSSVPMLVSDAANERLIDFLSFMSTGKYLVFVIVCLVLLYGSITLSIAILKRKEV
jgi:ABC-2 type transport system permease protein